MRAGGGAGQTVATAVGFPSGRYKRSMSNGCKTVKVLKATELDTLSQGIFLTSF